MTPGLVGGLAAATFAVGILTGAAGTIVIRDAAPNQSAIMVDHMSGQGMNAMMSGSMMGPGSQPGPGMMKAPGASRMPGSLHDQHHRSAAPDGPR
jgi:hypothetical protein